MTATVQQATSDTFGRQGAAGTNYGARTYLAVSNASGDSCYAYVYFNRPFPLGVNVLSATLRLFQREDASGGSRTLTAQRIAAKWDESTLTFANKPAVTGATAVSAAQGDGGVAGRVWEMDVTALMQTVADGAAWYGFRITASVATLLYLFSSESDLFPPQMEIEWSDAPETPTVLSPANGRAVSIARPTLRFDFTDNSGDQTMQAYQVQINSSDVWTAPLIDTGTVASTLPQHTLTADTPVATVRFWRVRVQDGAGLWSGWSEGVSFTRTAKPTVTIDSPAGVVTESTPPILWTAAGQTAYQVFLTDPVDTSTVLWTSGKVTSTDHSINLPDLATPLLTPGGEYGLTMRIWDAVDRESTPGDPIYTDASTTFTFDLTSGVAPVTDLAVLITPGRPDATVTFERSTAADAYVLLLDGVAVRTAEPGDLSTGGTTYAWVNVPSPRHAHVWSVLAVVDGETSDDNPTIPGTTEPTGVWLLTPDGVHMLFIANPSGDTHPIRYSPSELSSVRKPLGATNPVLITQAVYGADGNADGFAKAGAGQTLDDARAAWAAMTELGGAYRGKPLMLVDVDATMQVMAYNMVATARHEYVDKFGVSFDFFVVR